MSQGIQHKSLFKIVVIVLVLFFLVIITRIKLLSNTKNNGNNTNPKPVVCTVEAKLCSDGSYVGRRGPKCEFDPCPAISTKPVTTTITSTSTASSKILFKYPDAKSLGEKYWIDLWGAEGSEFGVRVEMLNKSYSCQEGTRVVVEGQGEVNFTQKIIGGNKYCVAVTSDGAAGSTYYTYSYTFVKNGKTLALTFVLRFSGCYNYDEPTKSECEKKRDSFNVDLFADQIVRSIRLK